MPDKEATARIKINTLLEAAGWRFFAEGAASANIRLEPSVTIKSNDLDALGDNFEKSAKAFVDFLLLDAKGFPLLVLEAKAEDKNPLATKEQARKYAKSQNCRFIILSNGNLHYFWDLERGNPYVITSFPTPDSVIGYQKVAPNPQRLIDEQVNDDFIVRTQRPNYQSEADYQTVIYKEKRDDWRRAEIIVTTVQSLLFNNKYQKLFSTQGLRSRHFRRSASFHWWQCARRVWSAQRDGALDFGSLTFNTDPEANADKEGGLNIA